MWDAAADRKGTIFNIQKMSIHDGPGIRTTVFLKGCPFSCLWCSNPESQRPERDVAVLANRCISCGWCTNVCPQHIIEECGEYRITDRSRCTLCLKCVDECCTGAKKVVGNEYSVDQIFEEIMRDKPFYDSSGGGVTFSGGEPFMQAGFLTAVLAKCREEGLHTAIETTGMGDTEEIKAALPLLDLIFFDVKHMDDSEHRKLTKASNKRILENLAVIAGLHGNITVRVPVIPGVNDSPENIQATAEYVSELGISALELLPYHRLGESKYAQLDMEYQLSDIREPSEEHMRELAECAGAAVGDRGTEVRVMPSF